MTGDAPELRCADADREKVAARLREHYAQGRLTLQEFDERVSAAYTAKTFGDLVPLTADLPAEAGTAAPAPATDEEAVKARKRLLAMWTPWLTVNAICTLIWLLTDPGGYFWPIWVMGPWGIILLMGTLGGARSQRRHLEHRQQRREHRLEHHRDRLERRRGERGRPSGELE